MLVPTSPFFFCERCLSLFHYDDQGKLLTSPFNLQCLWCVKIEQNNFAGLGTTGGGVAGASFTTVREGIRAQIQHLKAYGSKDALKNECVDPRFSLVTRGSAPYVEWLGQKENPNGYGWATSEGYGIDIEKMVKNLQTY